MWDKLKNISGDKQLWVYTILLMLFSFWIVYSASSNLVNTYGKTSAAFFGIKHAVMVGLGLLVLFVTHKLNPRIFGYFASLGMPVMMMVLAYTLVRGIAMGGASRWIHVPMLGSVQPSTIATVFTMMFAARFLGRNDLSKISFWQSIKTFWIWIFLTAALIVKANFSTAFLLVVMVFILAVIAGYPLKELSKIIGLTIAGLLLGLLLLKAFPELTPGRSGTWLSRIERHFTPYQTDAQGDIIINDKNRQEIHAKIAIAKGGVFGFRPGKSIEKNFLSQSVSDFIFAIIIEEYSLMGGILIILVYLLLGLRFYFIAARADNPYYKLLVIGLGFPLLIQAVVNMSVAVGLIPITGQPLPFLSSGGTSILMSSFSVGVILSISRYTELKEKGILDEYITA